MAKSTATKWFPGQIVDNIGDERFVFFDQFPNDYASTLVEKDSPRVRIMLVF